MISRIFFEKFFGKIFMRFYVIFVARPFRRVVTSYMVIIMYPIIMDPSTLLTFFT